MKTLEQITASGKLWNIHRRGLLYNALVKLPDCKTCSVIWSDNEYGWEHVSVSPVKQYSLPSWDDMCFIKDIFFDDEEEVYQIHPPKSEYVNVKENCLHLWKPININLKELVNDQLIKNNS